MQDKYGSYTAFADVIDFVFNWLRGIVGDNIILCIENNSIGRAPIEILRQFKTKTDYDSFIYRENEEDLGKKPENYGIKTTGLTKPLMAGCLMECVGDNIQGVKSKDLIDQFSNIERTASGGIKATGFSDLFMAGCFCAYVRNKKAFQILPIIEKTPEVHYSEISNFMTGLIKGTSVKEKQDKDQKIQNDMFTGEEEQEEFILPFDSGMDEQESDTGGFLGFFSS